MSADGRTGLESYVECQEVEGGTAGVQGLASPFSLRCPCASLHHGSLRQHVWGLRRRKEHTWRIWWPVLTSIIRAGCNAGESWTFKNTPLDSHLDVTGEQWSCWELEEDRARVPGALGSKACSPRCSPTSLTLCLFSMTKWTREKELGKNRRKKEDRN